MTLSAGTRLGPYEILSPLGAGGMGEVYRARDARLSRDVAIKVLPEAVANDPDRLARFQREAQVLAALNHTSIAHIHGLEDSGGTPALILELVEGETLAERIAAGPLSLDDALAVARQIADALEAAHEKGIVHRDLKPANVKLTPDGKVKVLDFGLAKVFERALDAPGREQAAASDHPMAERSPTAMPTVTTAGTRAGVVLGTASYMSPEQARGKPVDKRSDIWAFGTVLFEMLTGRKAFEGETVSDTLAAVLTREPDWSALPAGTPASVSRLLKRCLDRDPKRRLHDIADARLELDEPPAPPDAVAQFAPARRSVRPGLLAAVAILAAGVAALLTWKLLSRPAAAGSPTAVKLSRLTRDGATSEWPSWSADGNLLAYASNRTGNFEIYVRRPGGDEDVNITRDDAQDVQPAFSPDGGTIAFVSTRSSQTGLIRIGGNYGWNVRTYGGDLWVVPALGGGARRLASNANYPAWRPDGSAILYVGGPENSRSILEVPAGGGAPREVLSSAKSTFEITRVGCSPDGRWVSFETQPDGIRLLPTGGGTPLEVPAGFGHAWDPSSGRLYFCVRDTAGGSRIQFVPVNAAGPGKTRKTISLTTTDLMSLAVSRDGLQIVVAELESSRNLTRVPLAAGGGAPSGPEEPITSGRLTDSYPSVSPDNRRVALVSDHLGHMDVRVIDLESRRSEKVVLPGEDVAQVSPVWMPDGRQLLISRSQMGGLTSNWIVAVDGSRAEELFPSRAQGAWTIYPSPDGKLISFIDLAADVPQVFLYDLAAKKRTQLTDTPGAKFDCAFSPDGKSIAVTGLKDGVSQLFQLPIAGGALKQLTTGYERMRHPSFSPDSEWIYIQPSHRNIYRVRTEGGPMEQVTRFPDAGLFLEEPTVSPDGKHLYYCRGNSGSSLWLMTLEGPGKTR